MRKVTIKWRRQGASVEHAALGQLADSPATYTVEAATVRDGVLILEYADRIVMHNLDKVDYIEFSKD